MSTLINSVFSKLNSNLSFNINKIKDGNKEEAKIEKDKMIQILKTSPEILAEFENAYRKEVINKNNSSFDDSKNAKQMASVMNNEPPENTIEIINRIVNELLAETFVYKYDGVDGIIVNEKKLLPDHQMVTNDELLAFPMDIRPELAGNLIKRDLSDREDGWKLLINYYLNSKTNPDLQKRKKAYNLFRQGLDILDLSPVIYAMIDTNPNSMGHWLPQLIDAVKCQDYFKVPKTTLIKVPLPLLQLTRLEYQSHTPTTLKIVDEYCYKVFGLDESKTYFIRTGTASLKYDFRNVKVSGAKEVHELGEYLLYNHFRGIEMAGPLSSPSIYGMQTTTEWAVREFIEPKEKLPEIYFGLPLRLEMRIFIDADEKKVLGIAPYWDPKTMKHRFSMDNDFQNPDKIHDYAVYSAYESTLTKRYEEKKELVIQKVSELLPHLNLSGQWSLDVMYNGINDDGSDDVYLIDMALAESSALSEYVPNGLLYKREENWIPEYLYIENTKEGEQE